MKTRLVKSNNQNLFLFFPFLDPQESEMNQATLSASGPLTPGATTSTTSSTAVVQV